MVTPYVKISENVHHTDLATMTRVGSFE